MRKVFKYIKKLQTNPKILSCNVFMCHPFLSDPDLGWSVYVITDNDQALAEAIAEEIADMCWEVRDKKSPKFIDIDTMITEVKKAKLARKFGCITVYPKKQIGMLIKNEDKIKKITIFTILFLLITLGFYFFNKFKSNKKK